MTDQAVLAEVESAPVPEGTATPEIAHEAPEIVENPPEQKADERKFTQAELDELIGKRLAREQRKWERQQQAKLAETQAKPANAAETPSVDQFESPEAYAEALAVRKAEELLQQREIQKQQMAIQEAYHEREEQAREKYSDFEQVAYNPKLPITQTMAEAIQSSDIGPDLAYWLGSNPKEAGRISQLSPILQAREIGKIEAKIASEPTPTKKASTAPAPITPVTSRAANVAYDTTDPRSTKTMSASEWIEAERARQIRKLQANMNR